MTFKSLAHGVGLLVYACALACLPARAGTFPSSPIKLVVGFPPGGGTDILARIIAPALSANTGESVIVLNQGGANGIIGEGMVAASKPDGYTLFFGTAGNIAVNPELYKKLPFDVMRDFAPITKVADATLVLVVNPSVPAHSVKDLIALAKAKPDGVRFSTSGTGSLLHLGGELLNTEAHIKMTHIPYRGSAPSMTAVVSGQVEAAVDTVLLMQPLIKAGKVRALAVLSNKRSPLLPDVPAVSETLPGFDVTNWFGVLAPAKTPPQIRKYLHDQLVKALDTPKVQEQLLRQGAVAAPTSPEEFSKLIHSEMARWSAVIKNAHIQVE